jgi:hypothetical protein
MDPTRRTPWPSKSAPSDIATRTQNEKVSMEVEFRKDRAPQHGDKASFQISADNGNRYSALQALKAEVTRNGNPPLSGLYDDRIVALWDEMVAVLTSHEATDFEAYCVGELWTTFRLR